jgi:hypothetical protein
MDWTQGLSTYLVVAKNYHSQYYLKKCQRFAKQGFILRYMMEGPHGHRIVLAGCLLNIDIPLRAVRQMCSA